MFINSRSCYSGKVRLSLMMILVNFFIFPKKHGVASHSNHLSKVVLLMDSTGFYRKRTKTTGELSSQVTLTIFVWQSDRIFLSLE